jgi:hypothetical protein
MAITRDVHFHEEEQWDWGDSQRNVQLADPLQDESFDDSLIRGT